MAVLKFRVLMQSELSKITVHSSAKFFNGLLSKIQMWFTALKHGTILVNVPELQTWLTMTVMKSLLQNITLPLYNVTSESVWAKKVLKIITGLRKQPGEPRGDQENIKCQSLQTESSSMNRTNLLSKNVLCL